MTVRTISPQEFMQVCKGAPAVDFIDVRTPVEYAEVHAEGTRLVPLDSLDPKAVCASRRGPADAPVYVICKTGGRAAKACEKFAAAGFANVASVAGGTEAWVAAGLPVVRSKGVISLERQVRIAAGSMVLIGVALGVLVNPWFLVVSGFMGAGLTFAGITNTCGMGLLLARMPWNSHQPGGGSCNPR
jgi:rhodanese-related sulfurtransferase